jgi:cytochrome c-type biogenesis protein CcmH/NrfG
LLLLLGRVEESESWVREAVKLDPKSRDVYFELARVLLKKGDSAAAADAGELALGLGDGVTADTAIHYLLIRAWQKAGNPDKAAAHAGAIRAQDK